MPVFTLEALDANSGDALLVHYGTATNPKLMVVDGGFSSTYRDRMKPRLAELRAAAGGPGSLPIEHVVVSHLDSDHITGILKMFEELEDAHDQGAALPYEVEHLWHNSFVDAFDAIAGPTGLPADPDDLAAGSGAVAASVPQARALRDIADKLGLDGNDPFAGLVIGPREVDLGNGMAATVVGPDAERLEDLQDEWEATVASIAAVDPGDAVVASFTDKSVPNLSSIVVHLRFDGHTMLLTGDGRGDHTLAGLEEAGLLDANGNCHVDVLKVPHHGSDHTLAREYFERITADHYVISGNGHDDNPSAQTLEWITSTQGNRPYTIHLTYPHHIEVLDDDQAANPGRQYQVVVRPPARGSLRVDLGDPLP